MRAEIYPSEFGFGVRLVEDIGDRVAIRYLVEMEGPWGFARSKYAAKHVARVIEERLTDGMKVEHAVGFSGVKALEEIDSNGKAIRRWMYGWAAGAFGFREVPA